MEGGEELIFTGEYKRFSLSVRFDLSGKEPAYAAAALAYISEHIEPHAFGFSGIDTTVVDNFAAPEGKGLKAVCAFFEKYPPAAIRGGLMKACPAPELISVAESCLFNMLLVKAGVPFRPPSSGTKPDGHGKEDFIGFIGNYRGWIAIKKLSLEKVKDYEVSGILSGVNNTVVNKAFDLYEAEKDEALVESLVKGKRKSYGNAGACLKELEGSLSGGAGDAYAVCKTLEKLGYKPYASPEMLTSAHPDIKPPKVRGRKPKG